jgi:hypothetical protein
MFAKLFALFLLFAVVRGDYYADFNAFVAKAAEDAVGNDKVINMANNLVSVSNTYCPETSDNRIQYNATFASGQTHTLALTCSYGITPLSGYNFIGRVVWAFLKDGACSYGNFILVWARSDQTDPVKTICPF